MWREVHGWLTCAKPPRQNSDFFSTHLVGFFWEQTSFFFPRCSSRGLFNKEDTNLEYLNILFEPVICWNWFPVVKVSSKSLTQIQCKSVSNYQHPYLALRLRRINQKKTITCRWTSISLMSQVWITWNYSRLFSMSLMTSRCYQTS